MLKAAAIALTAAAALALVPAGGAGTARPTLVVQGSDYGPILWDGGNRVLYAFHGRPAREEPLLRRLCRGVAAVLRVRHAAGRQGRQAVAARDDPPGRRPAPDHLRRPAALLLRRRRQGPRPLPGRHRVRRRLARDPRQRQARPLATVPGAARPARRSLGCVEGLSQKDAAAAAAERGTSRRRRRAAPTRASSAPTSSRSSTSSCSSSACCTLALRRLARRALPGDPGRQRGDRHRPGGPRQARARPARRARRADGDGRARRRAARAAGRRRCVVGDLVRVAAGDQVVADGPLVARRRAARSTSRSSPASRSPSRAPPARRCAPARSRSRAPAPTWSRRSARTATPSGVTGEARAVPPSALAARARAQPAAAGPGRGARAALRSCSATRSGSATRRAAKRPRPRSRPVVTLVPEGLILLTQPHVRRRRASRWPGAACSPSS